MVKSFVARTAITIVSWTGISAARRRITIESASLSSLDFPMHRMRSSLRSRLRGLLVVLVALGLAAPACATGTSSGGDDPVDGGSEAAPTTSVPPGSDAGSPRDGASDSATPGARAPAVGEVIFSEMMINPDGLSDEFGEWVELYNTTDAPLELAKCRLGDEGTPKDDREIDVPSLVIPAKSAIVLARSGTASANGGISGVAFEYGNGFVLANTGDSAILTCGGTVIDKVVLTTAFPFDKGATMQVKVSARTATANDTPAGWCKATLSFGTSAQFGTPGNTQNHCP